MTGPDPNTTAALASLVDAQGFDVERALSEVRFAASPSTLLEGAPDRMLTRRLPHPRRPRSSVGSIAVIAGLTAVALVVVALVTPQSGPPMGAARSAPDLTIVVNGQVVGMDGDTIATPSPTSSDVMSWSPDGTRFVTSTNDVVFDVDVADGARISLASGGAPAWSPDGRVVVFESSAGLSALDIADGQVQPITEGVHQLPSWAPDGSQLAFVQSGRVGGERVMVAAAGTTRPIFDVTAGRHVGAPVTWSPDGREVAVSDGQDVFVVTLATGAIRPLTVGPGYEYAPAWSPRGDQIAFVTGGSRDVYTVSPTGQRLHLEAQVSGPVTQVAWRNQDPDPVSFGPAEVLVDGLASRCACTSPSASRTGSAEIA